MRGEEYKEKRKKLANFPELGNDQFKSTRSPRNPKQEKVPIWTQHSIKPKDREGTVSWSWTRAGGDDTLF